MPLSLVRAHHVTACSLAPPPRRRRALPPCTNLARNPMLSITPSFRQRRQVPAQRAVPRRLHPRPRAGGLLPRLVRQRVPRRLCLHRPRRRERQPLQVPAVPRHLQQLLDYHRRRHLPRLDPAVARSRARRHRASGAAAIGCWEGFEGGIPSAWHTTPLSATNHKAARH